MILRIYPDLIAKVVPSTSHSSSYTSLIRPVSVHTSHTDFATPTPRDTLAPRLVHATHTRLRLVGLDTPSTGTNVLALSSRSRAICALTERVENNVRKRNLTEKCEWLYSVLAWATLTLGSPPRLRRHHNRWCDASARLTYPASTSRSAHGWQS